MKKIYPIDWKKIHPEGRAMSTDMYYSELSNRVLNVLEETGIDAVLPMRDAMRDAAVRLTGWFEDICSGNMLWSVVNTVCQQRFGKPLPFYDTSNYYPGEPNIQDIRLLLWDIIQSHRQDCVINPENPGIELAAAMMLNIFDEEYETAPETEELIEYLSDPTIAEDYWQARKVMEWFSLGSYLSLRSNLDLQEALLEDADEDSDELFRVKEYTMHLAHIFVSKQYVMQLTAAEWLSMATKREMSIDRSRTQLGGYEILERGDEVFLLRDIIDGTKLRVQTESFSLDWMKKYAPTVKKVFCQIIGYNGKWFQYGVMVSDPERKTEENYLDSIRARLRKEENVRFSHELFQKKAGTPIVFLKGIDEYMDFQEKKIGMKSTEDLRRAMERHLRENSEHGMVAVMSNPKEGILTISMAIPAIKAPNNPWYDKDYARKNALNLIVQPMAIDYSAAVYLVENGMLPDAALTSGKGYDYGRKQVQDNVRYLVDYFFTRHEE